MKILENHYLTPSSVGVLKINATTGKEIITEQKELFVYIDQDFKKFSLDKESESTKETQAVPYDIVKDGEFKQIFEGFNIPFKKLSFTMGQVIDIVKKNKNSLAPDCRANLFLVRGRKIFFLIPFIFLVNLFIKKNKIDYYKYFVVGVRVGSDGLFVSVDRFEFDRVWDGESHRRVVVPQLDS